jgi:enediyne biosynthesis protein E4
VGDLNNDGFEDIVVTSLNERPRILMNSDGNGNHWLALELVGTSSNRDAIRAKVKVTTVSGSTLYNHVSVSVSVSVGLMSSSDKRVHFGLGGENRVKSIEIRWPRGAKQSLADVAADRYLKIEEPPTH